MASIEPYIRPRTQETISADLHAAVDYRWKLIGLAADFHNCQPLPPIYVVPGSPAMIETTLAELPPDLKEAIRLAAHSVALLESELYEAYQRALSHPLHSHR